MIVESEQWVQEVRQIILTAFSALTTFHNKKNFQEMQKCTKNKMFLELILAGSNKHITVSDLNIASTDGMKRLTLYYLFLSDINFLCPFYLVSNELFSYTYHSVFQSSFQCDPSQQSLSPPICS